MSSPQLQSETNGENPNDTNTASEAIVAANNSSTCSNDNCFLQSGIASPSTRSSNFTFSNRTVSSYPTQTTLPQKSAPANSSILSEMVDLRVDQPSSWRNFTISSNEKFLAVDGASQSAVLTVLIEVYSPDGSVSKAMNTTSSQTLHYLEPSPTAGSWGIHMALGDVGNTTVWIQAISLNRGTKEVTDYHKEVLHMYAGQAAYFKITLAANDWFDVHTQRLAGAQMTFEIFSTTDLINFWQSSYDRLDYFVTPAQAPQLGMYLFVARDYQYGGGDKDVLIQITKKAAVTKALFPNSKMALEFNLASENEYFIVDVNQSYMWLMLDGGVTDGGWTHYWLRDPSATVVADIYSYTDYPVSQPIREPSIGQYLLILQGSGSDTVSTVQITVNDVDETYLSAKTDLALAFQQTGQTLYFSINTTGKLFFVFSGSSERGVTIYRLFNFRTELVWGPYQSYSVSNAQYTLQIPVGNKYLFSVQGQKASVALVHIRFSGDHDYLLSSPDYSDFEMRFSGDFLMYQWVVPGIAKYSVQYWNTLVQAQIIGQVYDANYANMASIYLYYQGSGDRRIWRAGIDSYAAGNWIVFITGEKCNYIRVSHLRDGNEERIVNTPFQVFETFDFDYQARVFLINVPSSVWFSVVAALQTGGTSFLRVYDSQLASQGDSNIAYPSQVYPQKWQQQKTGNWLMVIDGTSSANVSLTFFSSADPMNSSLFGNYYTDEFDYDGECQYYHMDIVSKPLLGFDVMGMADSRYTFFYIMDPDGATAYYAYSYTKFDVNHYLSLAPQNGTWYIMLIGFQRSKIVHRATTASDETELIPFTDSIASDFDGKVTYLSFSIGQMDTLTINITSLVDSDSWLYLHTPSGQLWSWYPYHFTTRNQEMSITVNSPPPGEWHLCFIQEIYANLTVTCGGEIPLRSGVFVEFIYPPDAQMFNFNGTHVVLPEINGTINVVVNVTDYYHSISIARLYYNAGTNSTDMIYNVNSHFYETSFDTRILPDGLSELVAYAVCQNSELGIASLGIRVNNNGTFPPIDDTTPPVISKVYRDLQNVSAYQSPLVWAVVVDKDTAVSLVLLSYSTDNGLTWNDITMAKNDKITFQTNIPGFPAGTRVMYSVTAYDYVNNRAVENNAGEYYIYSVVPEFQSLLVLSFLVVATLMVAIIHRRKL